METKLIYVSKGKAQIKNDNDGSFICETPSIICKAGDLVSVEAVCVETLGTGSNVIEIPRQVSKYDYITNEARIEYMFYIHANFDYTCILPIKLGAGGGGTGASIYFNPNNLNYGDMTPSLFTLNHNRDYIPKNSFLTQTYGGTRLYIGTFGDDGDDVYDPMKSTTMDDPLLGTGNKVFNFMTSKIPYKVDYGYNTPENIATDITFQSHSAMLTPNQNNSLTGDIPTNDVEINNSYSPLSTAITQQATATNRDGAVITINGLPNQYFGKTADPANTYYYSTYSNYLAVKNPFYWYWGSRLQAQAPNGTPKLNNWVQSQLGGFVTQGDIINCSLMRNNGTDTTIQEGDILITNLPYTEDALKKVAKLIHHEKLYMSNNKTQEEMIADRDNFQTYIPIGKYDDSATAPADTQAKLQSKILNLANTATPTNLIVPSYTTITKDDYVDGFNLPNTPASIGKANGGITIDGIVFESGYEASKYLDVIIYEISLVDPVSGQQELVIGLWLKQQTIPNIIIQAGNFCLVDLTFTREQAFSAMILSPDVASGKSGSQLNELIKGFNVGSPNINLEFNGDRSRFVWKNMYWNNYLGNDINVAKTDENPDPEQEVFTCNKLKTSGDYYKPSLSQLIYNQYAKSGLGFYKYSVKDTNGNWVEVDEDNQDDVNKKFKNSLFNRIGFELGDLLNKYGLSNVFYQERQIFNNEPTKYPQYFPYPLTCNPQIDSAFNISINATDTNLPMFSQSLERNVTNINIAVQTAEIPARNKPTKLATPYWLIESDLISALKYYVDSNPRNVMAVVNRAYGSGDAVYSFAQDYKFINTKEFVISQIKSNILTSDLLPADVDDNTTIIYKIESEIRPNFIPATILAEEEEKNPDVDDDPDYEKFMTSLID
jgi:hypothetical protein